MDDAIHKQQEPQRFSAPHSFLALSCLVQAYVNYHTVHSLIALITGIFVIGAFMTMSMFVVSRSTAICALEKTRRKVNQAGTIEQF